MDIYREGRPKELCIATAFGKDQNGDALGRSFDITLHE